MAVEQDDWRRMGQESFLVPGPLSRGRSTRAYSDEWEHDHCVMCTLKFMDPGHSPESTAMVAKDPEILLEGYATTEEYIRGAEYEWACPNCFDDFAEEYGWIDRSASLP